MNLESIMLCFYSTISHRFVNPRRYVYFLVQFISDFSGILSKYAERKHFPCMIAMPESLK